MEKVNNIFMERVDKVFNLNAYRDWAKRTYGSGSVPDWARACNGRQAYLENGQTLWVIGLDGEYYRCHIECLTPPASGRQFVTGGVIEIAATVLERNAKVEKNAGLVYYLVLKNNNGVPDDDLAQEGFVALIKKRSAVCYVCGEIHRRVYQNLQKPEPNYQAQPHRRQRQFQIRECR